MKPILRLDMNDERMPVNLRVIAAIACALCAMAGGRSDAVTYTGTVISVEGDVAKIAMNGDVFPPVGAHAEIFFKMAGSNDEISVATGSALKIDHGDFLVKIENATGTVEKGQLVRFGPAEPPASTATPVPTEPASSPIETPTSSLPPSIPFPSAAPKSSPPPPVTQIDPAVSQLLSRGIAQYSAGDIAGAIASYTEAIRIAPKLAGAYLNRANAYLYKPDFRAAIADANKALELKVEKAEDAYVIRGAAEAGLGHYDAAIADCNRALKINPSNALAYNNRANDKLRKGDYKGALADCNKSIALNPNFALPYYNRGYAYYNLGNMAGALADWKKAVRMQPSFGAELNPRISQLEAQAPRKSR